jgi:hypothetical protein
VVEKYGFASSGAQLSHNCQAKGGIGMKTAMAVVLVAALLCLAAGTSLAVDGTDTATATLTVEEIINVEVNWRSTGTPTKDFGTVPTGVGVNDYLDIDIDHNMDPSQVFLLGDRMYRLSGPEWADEIVTYDGTDSHSWGEGVFGALQYFSTPIGGSSQVFTESLEVTFVVGSGQTYGAFEFQIDIIVTSI